MKNQKGFTLIEMMIVLLVISVLLIITVPNIATHSSNINSKGCEGYIKMVEAQVQAYKIDNNSIPTFDQLKTDKYLKNTGSQCPDGKTELVINSDGSVLKKEESTVTGP
ncbi:competence type IV pilus major pilin ComGC [Mesobacillus sp. LC4]